MKKIRLLKASDFWILRAHLTSSFVCLGRLDFTSFFYPLLIPFLHICSIWFKFKFLYLFHYPSVLISNQMRQCLRKGWKHCFDWSGHRLISLWNTAPQLPPPTYSLSLTEPPSPNPIAGYSKEWVEWHRAIIREEHRIFATLFSNNVFVLSQWSSTQSNLSAVTLPINTLLLN